jgi:hypothetical protein
MPCVLLARRVAVAGPPATVGPPREADHPQPRPPATWPPKRRVGPQPREEKCDGAVRTESARVSSPTILSNSRSTTPNVLATTPPLTSPQLSGQRQPSEQPECIFQDGGKIVRRPGSQSAGSGFESLMAHHRASRWPVALLGQARSFQLVSQLSATSPQESAVSSRRIASAQRAGSRPRRPAGSRS